jgi:hypothetical protein
MTARLQVVPLPLTAPWHRYLLEPIPNLFLVICQPRAEWHLLKAQVPELIVERG